MKIFHWLAASAVDDPEMPAKKIDSTTFICASAPGKCPTMRARQAHQAVGDAADVHQVRGEQEERHREQDERVVGVEGLLHQRHRRELLLDDSIGRQARPSANATGTRSASSAKKTPNRMRPPPGRERARRRIMPVRSAGEHAEVVDHPLALEDEPGRAGERPGDVDQPQRQLGELRDAVPGEPGELDAEPEEDEREDEHREPADDPQRAPRRAAPSCGQMSTSKCVPSRTPIMAPIMIIQMKRKRAISSVQM